MDTKSLLIGIVSFIAGGLLVSTAATTFDKPVTENKIGSSSMTPKVDTLKDKSGDEFDKEFLSQMILHHEGAVKMAQLSAQNAKHDEIKQLSLDIISAQEKEILEMKQWQADWGYKDTDSVTHGDGHN